MLPFFIFDSVLAHSNGKPLFRYTDSITSPAKRMQRINARSKHVSASITFSIDDVAMCACAFNFPNSQVKHYNSHSMKFYHSIQLSFPFSRYAKYHPFGKTFLRPEHCSHDVCSIVPAELLLAIFFHQPSAPCQVPWSNHNHKYIITSSITYKFIRERFHFGCFAFIRSCYYSMFLFLNSLCLSVWLCALHCDGVSQQLIYLYWSIVAFPLTSHHPLSCERARSNILHYRTNRKIIWHLNCNLILLKYYAIWFGSFLGVQLRRFK